MTSLDRISNGRTDLVFEHLAANHNPNSEDESGVSLLQWCAYYGDVSALKFLLSHGANLHSLGENLGLTGACFHGHWRLCQFLLERGANADAALPDTGETPLHSAVSSARPGCVQVVQVLVAAGANPNRATLHNQETGAFMRDCRTKGETPLHRAAAFAGKSSIQILLDAGAAIDAKDMHGDSPLTWASWHGRPASILRKLCYGPFRVRPNYRGMSANLRGDLNLASRICCPRAGRR